MCSECAKVLRFQTNRCPICRCVVERLLEIKVPKTDIDSVNEKVGSSHRPKESTPTYDSGNEDVESSHGSVQGTLTDSGTVSSPDEANAEHEPQEVRKQS